MNISKEYSEKELKINVEGRVDTITAPELEKEIKNEYGNFNSLILDFTNLDYISSAGLRVLILIEKKLNPEGIPFTLTNLNDTIKEVITVSGFDKILNIK